MYIRVCGIVWSASVYVHTLTENPSLTPKDWVHCGKTRKDCNEFVSPQVHGQSHHSLTRSRCTTQNPKPINLILVQQSSVTSRGSQDATC